MTTLAGPGLPARADSSEHPLGFTLQTSLAADSQTAGQGPFFSTTGGTLTSELGTSTAGARGAWSGGTASIGAFVGTTGGDLVGDADFARAEANVLWTFTSATLAAGTDIVAHFNLRFDATMQTDTARYVDTHLGLEILDLDGQQVRNLFYEVASLSTQDGIALLGDYAGGNAPSFALNDEGIAVADRGSSLNDDLTAELKVGSTYIVSSSLSTALGGGEFGGVSRADAYNSLLYSFTRATLSDYSTPADVTALAAIPEPSTYAVWLGLAGLGVVFWRRVAAADGCAVAVRNGPRRWCDKKMEFILRLARWRPEIAILLPVVVAGALSGADIPYDANEVAALQAFLTRDSMIADRTNAQVLGVDPEAPSSWTGVSWVDHLPEDDPDDPATRLGARHVLNITWRNSLAGSLELKGFLCLGMVVLDNSKGSLGRRGGYDRLVVRDNPRLGSIAIRYANFNSLQVAGNPGLAHVALDMVDLGTFTLDAPMLKFLEVESGTVGNLQLDFARLPRIEWLRLTGGDNIATVDVSGCPELGLLHLVGMRSLASVVFGDMAKLGSLEVSGNAALERIDFRGLPAVHELGCGSNGRLRSLLVGGNPKLGSLVVGGNPVLASLVVTDLPELWKLDCQNCAALATVTVAGDPKLRLFECGNSALTALDVSGLPALDTLRAQNNRLALFASGGVVFDSIDLGNNRLMELAANVAGHPIAVRAHGGGGYVDLQACAAAGGAASLSIGAKGLPAPYNTTYRRVEGVDGLIGTVHGAVDAVVYFRTKLHFHDYFGRAADNPLGTGVDLTVNPTVGDPLGAWPPAEAPDFPLWSHDGHVLEGWYADAALTRRWALATDIVVGELTLYPNWIPESVPLVRSVARLAPADAHTAAASVTYRVVFSEVVTGIGPGDFSLSAVGTAAGRVAAVSAATGAAVEVTVADIGGSGSLRLDVRGSGTHIADLDGNLLRGGFTTGERYFVGGDGALTVFLAEHGLDAATPAGAADADPDGDGVCNLLEFVLGGGDPLVRNDHLLPAAQLSSGAGQRELDYSFWALPPGTSGYRVAIEYSTDLGNWRVAEDGVDGVELKVVAAGVLDAHTARFPANGGRLFVRLRVVPR